MRTAIATPTHRFHPTILREYDIRGIVGETLHDIDAETIGHAFGTLVRRKGGRTVCIGRDGRTSSPTLAQALTRGLVAAGCVVRDIGQGPTPMLYFAATITGADGGIMVTGSHNPPSHNGFKMVLGDNPFFGADIRDLGRLAAEGDLISESGGRAEPLDIAADYVTRLLRDFDGGRPLTVVWDCGNGATGDVLRQVVARLPGSHTVLFADIDGSFPNHHPDPTEPHNLVDLQREVARRCADLGIAFDGDGDRIGVVDGLGRILWGDQILMLLAEDVLRHAPGAVVMADVKASNALFAEVARLGGQPLMWRTGHSLIKTKMKETGCPLAGEMSGHIFFADRYFGFDDALYAAIRLLGIVGRWPDESLSQRHDRLPKLVNTPEMRIDCADERKHDIIRAVGEKLRAAGIPVNDIDGVRVDELGGWWLLRASNTQAVLVARCEAADTRHLELLKQRLQDVLAQFRLRLPS
ncbi:MAG: phosphoglucomutase/phosphomannomutase PgmG [Bacteroidota bacterium]